MGLAHGAPGAQFKFLASPWSQKERGILKMCLSVTWGVKVVIEDTSNTRAQVILVEVG